jgi:excisionase family DNA binding protein
MASETIDGQPITVTADDVQLARRTAAALRCLVADASPSDTTIMTADGHAVKVAPFLVSALHQLAALLAQGDDVALVPVHRELSPTEAATLLQVLVPFMLGLLDVGEIPSTGIGDDRRVHLSDLMAYKGRRSSENRRDLATALAVAQEAGPTTNCI